jgi:hypothetical protein
MTWVLWYVASFFLNNTLFGFWGTLYGTFGYINHDTLDFLRRSREDFLSGQFEGFSLTQGVFNPLNRLTYGTFTYSVIGGDGCHSTVFAVVFEGYGQFIRY